MENQHRKITGYRELTQDEIDLMNEIKALGAQFGELVDKVNAVNGALSNVDEDGHAIVKDAEAFRWSAIARTHLQEGCMALTRAVAKPKFF